MKNSELNSRIISSTRSNYSLVLVRVVFGLVTFRLLYQGLPPESFGFWAFLWGVFGLGALLDFGFGLTVQKSVAQLSARHDWEQLSRVLTTILYLYIALAIVITVCGVSIAPWIVDLVGVSVENRDEFIRTTAIFLFGMGLSFPLGLFPEILRGQHESRIANNLTMIGLAVNFALVVLATHLNWGLLVIVVNALVTALLPSLIAAYYGLRRLPEVHLVPANFTINLIRETLKFSTSAYIIMVSYLILTKTDQLLIAGMMSAASLAIYQPGSKIGEILGVATRQLANSLQPAAAYLYAKGDKAALRQLLVQGTRYSVLLATPIYLCCAFLMEPVLGILTGLVHTDSQTYWVAQILALWAYSFVITHNVYKRIAVMCGQEGRLVKVGVAETVMNLGLSVLSLSVFESVVGVAAATLASSLFFGWFFLWRWAFIDAALTGFEYTKNVIADGVLGSLPLLVWLLFAHVNPWFKVLNPYQYFILVGLFALIIGASGVWWLALGIQERQWVLGKSRPLLNRMPFVKRK